MNQKILEQNKAWIEETWKKIDEKMKRVAVKSREKIPYTTHNGVHDNRFDMDPGWWTNGFWGGMMWLLYRGTGNEEYRKTAVVSEKKMDEAFRNFDRLDHDAGFMWHLMSGANYRLTGDRTARTRNLFAAAALASRYNIDGKFIRAWNSENAAGWSIIDCMMNLSLLYWASEEIGDPRFYRIALSHAEMALRDHIRADGTVNHIVEHDTENGALIRVHGGQGFDDDSCWSRGLAWAVYGCVISYVYTKKKEFLHAAIRTANYFVTHARRTGYKTVVDFKAPAEPIYYDSTAGVCTACALLEIAKHVSEAEAESYTQEAINLLRATDEYFCDYTDKEDALVLMGTERYPLEQYPETQVHIPIVYGDFFFVEALLKLKGDTFFIW